MNPTEIKVNPDIEASWKEILIDDFNTDSFVSLKGFLREDKKNHVIYPPGNQIFTAFNLLPFDQVKAVILGQDPYHGEGQAHGMSFSVPKGVRQPPSLVNIFKEVKNDLGFEIPNHGNLEKWENEGRKQPI